MGCIPPRPTPPRIEIVRDGFFRTTIRPGPPVLNLAKRLREDKEASDEADRQVRLLEQALDEWDPPHRCPPWREPLPSEMV